MANQRSIKPSNRSRVGLLPGAGAQGPTGAVRLNGGPDVAKVAEIPGSPSRAGVRACVRDTSYYNSAASSNAFSLSTSPTSSAYSSSSVSDNESVASPPSYQSIFPPSPPSSAPSSPADSILSTLDDASTGHALRAASTTRSVSIGHANKFASAVPSTTVALATPPTTTYDAPIDAASRPTLLSTVFPPTSSIHSLPSFEVDLESTVGQGWKGVVVESSLVDHERTLYVGACASTFNDDASLRDSVCQVLDLAEEEYGVSAVVLCLEKGNDREQLGKIVHQLMYIGCTVVNPKSIVPNKKGGPSSSSITPNPAYLLLGMDL
ncbi:hypothetical protein JCM10212_004573 [Sporobolomyces blumeae]